MGTTNILDLNNRVDELEKSYPANNVMLSDGVTSVEEAIMSEPTTPQKNDNYIGDNLLKVLKIGNLVNVSGRFQIKTQKPAGQENYLFSNMPIPAGSIAPIYSDSTKSLIITSSGYLTSNGVVETGYLNINATYAEI